jgi:pyrroloquinoline quinone biosynthesis protein B
MKVRVLGTAAGGGVPQWNCACDGCRKARAGGTDRTQDCLAVSGDGRTCYLVNASPDLRTQLLSTPELTPGPGHRQTPLRGVLLTSAELDHTLGLLGLREAGQLTIHATASVRRALREALPIEPLLSRYTRTHWQTVVCGRAVALDGGLNVTAIPLGDKRPRYAEPHAGDDWVIGYRIEDRHTGSALLYAPCVPTWTNALSAAVREADAVILDGTFYDGDEMVTRTGLDRPAAGMGHLPICGSLPHLAAHAGPRYLYTHLNNTNPLTHPDAPQHAELAEVGAAVATDGQLLSL